MNHKSNGKGRKYVISSSTYIYISIQWSENNWVILLHNHIYGTQQNNWVILLHNHIYGTQENNWVILLHNHIYGTQQNNWELIAQYVSGEKCILHSSFMTKKKEDKELQLK